MTKTPSRRDELLYESDAALRLVDRAIQEMQVLDEGMGELYGEQDDVRGEGQDEEKGDTLGVAAGDAPAATLAPDAVE